MESIEPLLRARPNFISWKGAVRHLPMKRLFDVLFSLCVLILTLPLCLLIVATIKLTSRGPVFFLHRRVGRAGRTFFCYKFRTMYTGADSILAKALKEDPDLRRQWIRRRMLTPDPRITPFGRWLRRSCLDELPQFLNVLKGNLSVVGPRPVSHEEISIFYGPKAHKILKVRPGITGIWQTARKSYTSYSERVEMDEKYLDRRSLFYDVQLILKTIPLLFRSRATH